MTITRTGRRILALAGIAGASLVALPTATTAQPSATEATPPACAVGYVCMQTDRGSVVRIAAGDARRFDPALSIDWITNQTRLNYCVTGNPSFSLPAGRTSNRDQTVVAVGPGELCAS
jgi:hypothetical protein